MGGLQLIQILVLLVMYFFTFTYSDWLWPYCDFWRERRVLNAQQRTCQKYDEDFFLKMLISRIIQTLIIIKIKSHPWYHVSFCTILTNKSKKTFEKKIHNGRLKKTPPILNILLWKYQGLILGLVGKLMQTASMCNVSQIAYLN